MGLQLVVLVAVYIVAYGAYLAVKFTIAKHGISPLMYFPVIVAIVTFPLFLYQHRKIFEREGFLMAFIWMMGTGSLTMLLLYIYVSQVL